MSSAPDPDGSTSNTGTSRHLQHDITIFTTDSGFQQSYTPTKYHLAWSTKGRE